jgi:aspartate dehydrogenase
MQTRQQFTLGIGGLGAIGFEVATAIASGSIPDIQLTATSAARTELAVQRLASKSINVPVMPLCDLAEHCEIVIECAPAAVFDEVANPVIERGRILMPLSVGAILDRPQLAERARQSGARIIIPSGAMLGLDALKGVAEGSIRMVKLVTRKPPGGLKGAPYLVENDINLEGIEEARCVFSGSAREAARAFPANVNVAAALSLAGFGPDLTEVEVWADPTITRNMHCVSVEADSACMEMQISGVPDPANPRTGKLTAKSVLATLRRLVAPMVVGT